MTILENNSMQSTASSAGYSTSGTLISAFAAYMLVSNTTLPLMLAWVFLLAVLGVTMAAEPLVPWVRGINACASVVGAVLATLLAIHWGSLPS